MAYVQELENFSKADMIEGIKYCHDHGVKLFITANIMARNNDLDGVREYFKELNEMRPDAVIIGDPGVFIIAKEELKDIDIHISTQANNTNFETFKFWRNLGRNV